MAGRSGEPGPRPTRPGRAIGLGLVGVAVSAVVALAYVGAATRGEDAASEALAASSVETSTPLVQVPLRLLGGLPVVEASVQPPGSVEAAAVSLVLDTGAPTTITPELADRVAGDAIGEVHLVGLDGTTVLSEVVPVGSLGIGGAWFRDVAAVRGSLPPDDLLRCIGRDGLLGASTMSGAAWRVALTDRRVTVAATGDPLRPGPSGRGGAISLSFRPSSDVSPSPIVDVGVGEGTLPFVLDTGSNGWLAAHPDDLRALGGRVSSNGPAIRAIAATSGGPRQVRVVYGTADVAMGELGLRDLPIATTETLGRGMGVMGTDFLRHFVLTIDWPRRTVHLEPLATGSVPWPSVPRLATVGRHGGGAAVASFVEGRAATAAGLALGLPVLAIDGRDMRDLTPEQGCRLLTDPAPESFEMTLPGGRTVRVGTVDAFFEPPVAGGG